MLIGYSDLFNQIIKGIKTRKNNGKNLIGFSISTIYNDLVKIPGVDNAGENQRINTSRLYDHKVNLF